jgi:hypothetical protein
LVAPAFDGAGVGAGLPTHNGVKAAFEPPVAWLLNVHCHRLSEK